ncbi:hypothetical protein OROGR_017178 [Orobanche gracilis]
MCPAEDRIFRLDGASIRLNSDDPCLIQPKLNSEKHMTRGAVDRLLKVIRTPHPVAEVCRKAALILENLVMEPQNKPLMVAYENVFADMLFSESRYADTFARIFHELTYRPSNKIASARGIWGM